MRVQVCLTALLATFALYELHQSEANAADVPRAPDVPWTEEYPDLPSDLPEQELTAGEEKHLPNWCAFGFRGCFRLEGKRRTLARFEADELNKKCLVRLIRHHHSTNKYHIYRVRKAGNPLFFAIEVKPVAGSIYRMWSGPDTSDLRPYQYARRVDF